MISFVILHYKNINDTIECIESIKKLDRQKDISIIVVDNNSLNKNEIKYIENAQKNYNKNDESYNSIWNSVERFWRCCIEQNRVTSIENNPDKIIAVLKSYSDLRDVRNKLNHANFTNVSNETSEELEKEVINVLNVCVKSIEDIIKSK